MGKENCSQCGKELVSGEQIRCVYCDLNQVAAHSSQASGAESTNCGKCNLLTIRDKESLHCELCKIWYHNGCNEFALDDRYCSLVYEAPKNIKWFCDKCIWETEKWINGDPVKKENDEISSNKIVKRRVSRKRKKVTKNITSKKAKTSKRKIKHHCDICPKSFYDTQIFEAHKLWHTGDTKPFKCLECDKGFINKRKLNEHTEIHSNKRKHICDVCGKGFNWEELLKRHVSSIHSKEKPYSCYKCDLKFKRENTYTKHMQICKGPVETKCSICDYTTKRQGNMKAHMRTHSEEKIFVCNECGCRLKTLDGLKLHRATHSFEKPFKCQVCGIGFKQKENLITHMIVHNTTGKTFASKERLEKHAKTIPSGEQPFDCEICGNKYKTKQYLKIHQMTANCNETNTQKQAIKYVQKSAPPTQRQSIAASDSNSNDSAHYSQYNQQPHPLMVYSTGANNELRPPVYSTSHVSAATIHCPPPPPFSVYPGHYMG